MLLAVFDRRGGWSVEGVDCCAQWLSWRCGISLGAAREKVRVAWVLHVLPKISAAFSSGEPSFSTVRAVTRAARVSTTSAYCASLMALDGVG